MARLARLRDWSMLLVCNLIWGSQFVIYKIVQRQAGPVFAPLFPIFIALLLLIPLVRAERKRRNAEFTLTHGRDILEFLLIGVFGQVVA